MAQFTIDVLLIGLIAVLVVEAVKTPIKVILTKKGLKGNEKMQKIFNLIMLTIVLVVCFGASCIYFWCFNHVNPFASLNILWYTIGTLGSSQTIYKIVEAYGRDGIIMVIKQIFMSKSCVTNIDALQPPDKKLLSEKIAAGIQDMYEGAPVTSEDVQQILDHIL